MDYWRPNDQVIEFRCLHIVHLRCFRRWELTMIRRRRYPTCPVCRIAVPFYPYSGRRINNTEYGWILEHNYNASIQLNTPFDSEEEGYRPNLPYSNGEEMVECLWNEWNQMLNEQNQFGMDMDMDMEHKQNQVKLETERIWVIEMDKIDKETLKRFIHASAIKIWCR